MYILSRMYFASFGLDSKKKYRKELKNTFPKLARAQNVNT